jgi:hypothetical protein
MEQFGIIINDRSGKPISCEIYPEDQIELAVKQTLDFYNWTDANAQIVFGPLSQILEILESHGITLQPMEKQNGTT